MKPASRQLMHYRRKRRGRIVIQAEADEARLFEMLITTGYLHPSADGREALNAAVSQMLKDLTRKATAR